VADPFPVVEALIPHRGAALLVEAVDSVSPDGISCWGRVRPESPFAAEGWAPSFLGLEMGAQAAALFEALRREHHEGGPRLGYLVGIREASLSADLPVDRRVHVTARAAGGAGPLGVYDVSVDLDGVEFSRGLLSTFAA
jgi:predicted hotdog family 3-hydroxylacyl-ACP dehydratase